MIKDDINKNFENALEEIISSEIRAPERLIMDTHKKLAVKIQQHKRKSDQKNLILIMMIIVFNILVFGAYTFYNMIVFDDLVWRCILAYIGFSILCLMEVLILIVNDYRYDLKYIFVK